jgi:hypothetical protein
LPSCLSAWRAIAEAKQRLQKASHQMGDQNLLSRAPPCFGGHVKPLVPTTFTIVSTHQPALDQHDGLWPVLLMCDQCAPAVGTLIG